MFELFVNNFVLRKEKGKKKQKILIYRVYFYMGQKISYKPHIKLTCCPLTYENHMLFK
jgi:hypothetical protein